ncbi:MAG: hypothetical protein HC897_05530 [Thermoanaerobaculia bacterium]|nr:hypothetical protein [Thermoanaerobaculia bacterium]
MSIRNRRETAENRLPSSFMLGLMFALMAPTWLHAADPAPPGPSAEARGMCGAMGTIEFKPADWIGNPRHPNPPGPTTWWMDTDGIEPGTPGCHLGLTAAVDGKLNGRLFGEACTSDGLLVESNPGAGKVHGHVNDLGHPDTFDCNLWCKGKGYSEGHCEAAPAYPCPQSAKCTDVPATRPPTHGGCRAHDAG